MVYVVYCEGVPHKMNFKSLFCNQNKHKGQATKNTGQWNEYTVYNSYLNIYFLPWSFTLIEDQIVQNMPTNFLSQSTL